MKLPRIIRDIAPAWTPPGATGGWPPRPLLRIRLRAGLAFAAIAAASLLAMRYVPGWRSPKGAMNVVVALCLYGPLILTFWLLWRAERRVKRRVRARDGAVCTHCGYDLGDSDPEGVCPECGRTYTVRQLRWRWRGARMLPMPSRDETLREAMTVADLPPAPSDT